ncbi:WD repeat-containing protein 3 homolog isoform X2 [Olea europaea var. sylvestris]|nr:WD repeat-containing protein 3 homolog isoform X2 [Olea europaea var. sylvestris]
MIIFKSSSVIVGSCECSKVPAFCCQLYPLCLKEEKSKGKVADFRPNILMLGLPPPDYVLHTVSNVHTNDLEQTLLALPF